MIDERPVPLNQLVNRVGDEFEYHYDFGDDWRHWLLFEAILLPESGVNYPRCIGGARNGPPEDAGGPYGYANYLDALRDRDHEEHEQMLEWRGPWDPEAFPIESVNAALDKTFQRRKKTAVTKRGKAQAPPPLAGDDPQVAELTRKLVAILHGVDSVEPRRKYIPPGSKLPLELTDRERELILKHSFAEEDLTHRLRIVPPPGRPLIVHYTLGDLDHLAGYVASQANHCKNRELQKEWDRLFSKTAAILETHTDESE